MLNSVDPLVPLSTTVISVRLPFQRQHAKGRSLVSLISEYLDREVHTDMDDATQGSREGQRKQTQGRVRASAMPVSVKEKQRESVC